MVLTVRKVEITHGLGVIDAGIPKPPPIITITLQAPARFRGEHLLQLVDKRVEIRILEDQDAIG